MRLTSYKEAYALYQKAVEGTPQQSQMAHQPWLCPIFYCKDLAIEDGKKMVSLTLALTLALPIYC